MLEESVGGSSVEISLNVSPQGNPPPGAEPGGDNGCQCSLAESRRPRSWATLICLALVLLQVAHEGGLPRFPARRATVKRRTMPDPDPPDWSIIIQITLVFVFLAGSFFFALSETALMSSSRLRLQHLAEQGDPTAKLLLKLRKDPHRLLTTLLLGNNVVNIASASLATAIAIHLFGEDLGVVLATLMMTIVVLIFCEIVPKSMAAVHPERTSARIAVAVRAASFLLRPMVWLLEMITQPIVRLVTGRRPRRRPVSEDEIRTLVRIGQREGVIDRHESRFIQRVLNMGDIEVRQIMTPLADTRSVSAESTVEEAVRLLTAEYYSRLPVWRDDKNKIVGIVHLKDAARVLREQGPEAPLTTLMLPVRSVAPNDKVDDVLLLMQSLHAHVVVVENDDEEALGICTIEDVLEEIVGEIRDEHDYEEFGRLRAFGDGDAVAIGSASIYEVEDALGVELPAGDFRTLQGLIISRLGRAPAVGDTVDVGIASLTVEGVAKKKITRVRLSVNRPVEESSVG